MRPCDFMRGARAIRRACDITIESFAEQCGVNATLLCRLENGAREGAPYVAPIAEALGVPAALVVGADAALAWAVSDTRALAEIQRMYAERHAR